MTETCGACHEKYRTKRRKGDYVMKRIAMTVVLVLIAGSALAQSHQPYAGLQSRPVKALSDQQIADLRAGRGMTMALPAELNGYPGLCM